MRRMRGEQGFTLIELLVVMLILGILAAIAIVAFLNQQDKAKDAGAKEEVHAALIAMEVYASDHQDSYAGADGAALHAIESAVPSSTDVAVPATDPDGKFSVTVTSGNGNSFKLTRLDSGGVSASCSTAGRGGCPADGDWLKG